MTKREFRRLWAVPADIDARVRRMHRLEESLLRAPQVVTDTVQASGRSAPYALGTVTVRGVCAADGPAARARKRAEVRRMARALEQKNAQYEQDYADALRAIEGIEDAALRCAVQLACLEGMPWEAVADELGATGWYTPPENRRALRRFLSPPRRRRMRPGAKKGLIFRAK